MPSLLLLSNLAAFCQVGCRSEGARRRAEIEHFAKIVARVEREPARIEPWEDLLSRYDRPDSWDRAQLFSQISWLEPIVRRSPEAKRIFQLRALPVIRSGLCDGSGFVRREAALAAAEYGALAIPLIPELAQAVRTYPNEDTGWFSVEALEWIGPAAIDSVPTLVQALDVPPPSPPEPSRSHRLSDLRDFAAAALTSIGPRAPEAVPRLTAALDDSIPRFRVAAAGALLSIDPKGQASVRQLVRELQDQENAEDDRLAALQALSNHVMSVPGVRLELILAVAPHRSLREEAESKLVMSEKLAALLEDVAGRRVAENTETEIHAQRISEQLVAFAIRSSRWRRGRYLAVVELPEGSVLLVEIFEQSGGWRGSWWKWSDQY